MKHIGLFEGIGGFSLASEWMGWETLAWCEWEKFPQKILKYHFPQAEGFGDITKTDFTKYANRIDILTGGFPCQPFSNSGNQLGTEDSRYLWDEMLRTIRQIQPRWIVAENVRGLVSWSKGMVFDKVQADLEAEGYKILPFLLPACAVNAPHRRDRIWFIAYSESRGSGRLRNTGEQTGTCEFGISNEERNITDTNSTPNFSRGYLPTSENKHGVASNTGLLGQEECEKQTTGVKQCNQGIVTHATCLGGAENVGFGNGKSNIINKNGKTPGWEGFPTEPPICGGNDGLPTELDGITFSKWRNESLKGFGNAIVPQVAFQIFKAIEAYEMQLKNKLPLNFKNINN